MKQALPASLCSDGNPLWKFSEKPMKHRRPAKVAGSKPYIFSLISTDACVFSQLKLRTQLVPLGS
jgi:hypothetical protein